MNKKGIIVFGLLAVLLTACGGAKASWENESAVVKSDRLLADMVQVEWTVEEPIVRLKIAREDSTPIEAFDVTHEKLLHLIVVSKDLSYFNHIHPEYKGGGVFEVKNDFPAGGEYRMIADFKPSGGDSMTKMAWVQVDGAAAEAVPLVRETTLSDTADRKRVSLELEGLGAERETQLTFTVVDEATGAPVTDLEPYLGAIGHVVVLSEDGERYVHVHAEEDQGSGPEAKFEASFPAGGLYKLWAQFQQHGEVFTVSYTVDVPN